MNFIKKNLITILCIISILAMFLTFISFSVESEFMDNTQKCTGITACDYSFLGYVLLIAPAVLIAVHFIKQLQPYNGILSIAIPAICLIELLILFFSARDGLRAGGEIGTGFGNAVGVDMDYSVSIGIGAILMFLSHITMLILGLKKSQRFSLGKPNLSEINLDINSVKSASVDLIKSAKEGVSNVAQNIANNMPSNTSGSKKHIDDILSLIERLARMKNDGILTEEEFTKKKVKLLEEL